MTSRKGVRKGFTHHWKYTGRWIEKKIAPGKWRITFTATKRTNRQMGTLKPGTKVQWGFKNVRQTATKTGKGKYQTRMTGIKYLIKIKPRK